jgi:mono/diheme cytochrome c family protein
MISPRAAILASLLAFTAAPLSAQPTRGADDDLGARLYFNHCAACHGQDGEGGGPVAATMHIAMPNLRSLAMRNNGEFPDKAVTSYIDGREAPAAHGERQMPIWGDVFRGVEQGTAERTARRRIAALVAFVSTLQYR